MVGFFIINLVWRDEEPEVQLRIYVRITFLFSDRVAVCMCMVIGSCYVEGY